MRVLIIQNQPVEFTHVYTPDSPDPHYTPSKKPFIIFRIPGNNDNYEYLRQNCRPMTLLGILRIDPKTKELMLVITGHNKVNMAIKFFLERGRFVKAFKKNRVNLQLIDHLNDYKKALQMALEVKQLLGAEKKRPLISKTSHDFVEVPNSGKQFLLADVLNPTTHFFFKPNTRRIAELEVFNSYCSKLVLGDRYPLATTVYDQQRCGLVSLAVDGFISFRDYTKKHGRKISEQELLESEAVKVWVSAYVEDENDLHADNVGFNAKGMCVGIDGDQKSWPITSKYHFIDAEKGEPHLQYSVPPIKAFPVTERDLIDFPVLKDAKPHNAVHKTDTDLIVIGNMRLQKKFQEDKWRTFLKRILIADTTYIALAKACIASPKGQAQAIALKCTKTKDLTAALLNIADFRHYVKENPDQLEMIAQEIEDEFNCHFKKLTYAEIHVDVTELKATYKALLLQIDKHEETLLNNNNAPSPVMSK